MLAAGIVALVASRGIEAYADDSSMQHTILGLFIGAGAIMASLLIDPFGLPRKDGSDVSDERDFRVVERAPRVQSVAVILTLAAWLTFLTLRYHGSSAVPMVFLYLLFCSALIAHTLGLSLGVLLGYRKMARYGEG